MKRSLFLPMLFPMLLLCSMSFSQVTKLQIAGIPLESEILSYSWGASNPVTIVGSGGSAAGKVSISSFNMMKVQDANSIKFIQAVATGQQYPEAIITLYNSKGQPAFRFTLQKVYLESVQYSHSNCGNAKCELPTESLSIVAEKWKWQDLATGATYEYNVATNQ